LGVGIVIVIVAFFAGNPGETDQSGKGEKDGDGVHFHVECGYVVGLLWVVLLGN
jgi:hypothetical protein